MLTAHDASLRVIDFGLAHQYAMQEDGKTPKVEMLYHCCGSRSYCAPEVLNQAGYAFGADVWSCGVALFAMLLGFFPLEEASHADWRYDKLKRAQADGKCTVSTVLQWYGKSHTLTDEALSLLDGMLSIDKSCRLSPKATLEHPWFTSEALSQRRRTRSPVYRTRGRAAEEDETDETNLETVRADKQAIDASCGTGVSNVTWIQTCALGAIIQPRCLNVCQRSAHHLSRPPSGELGGLLGGHFGAATHVNYRRRFPARWNTRSVKRARPPRVPCGRGGCDARRRHCQSRRGRAIGATRFAAQCAIRSAGIYRHPT
mmetsp:Transcript_23675/g.65481  ORF Transcript_23675/g.65481 Transcript_23675/m.65481 type:complete len:315 (+) Transcript_23675:648-1592(+)